MGLLDQRAHGEPFKDSCSPRQRFGYCLVTVGGQAVVRETVSLVITKISDFRTTSEGRSESAPFRPDLATEQEFLDLEGLEWKLKLCSRQWNVSLSDGAYPRRERRGIAPASHIMSSDTRRRRFDDCSYHDLKDRR